MTRKFLVPIILPADPAAVMEAVTKQYVDGILVPGYVGPWRTGASTTDTTVAQHGTSVLRGKHGLLVDTATGFIRIVGSLNGTVANETLQFHQADATGYTTSWLASLHGPSTAPKWQVGSLMFGSHPSYTLWSIWDNTAPGAGDYMLLRDPAGPHTHINAGTGGTVTMRVNNATLLKAAAAQIDTYTSIVVNKNPGNLTWSSAHLLAYPTASSSEQARIALQSPGAAPQLRCVGTQGEKVGVINSTGSAYVPIGASAFETNSSLTAKRDVRHLTERERIIVRYPVEADKVPPIDVMSLRPVAYRPKVVSNDTDTGEPRVGILGHEERRERLGLIAEEVHTVIPSAVSHDCDGNALGIDYAQITVALLDHVQRLTDEVATLRYRLTELEGA